MKTRATLFLLAFLASAAGAQAQAFKDLPGVAPSDATDEYRHSGRVVCEQTVGASRSRDNRWIPRNIYVCEQNGVTASGTYLPPSSIRALRGLGY
ncbi:hypothetical protein GB928_007760 [Shinella curvata]|uniref:Uncharacterized protein n=1 Tax=Shinella curvata TaxID=1817964 RepID=A0ABT8XBF9_9HYPH|nr:hypothetical protein [Shinella curvata]MCJ8054055.1 hypothetical protein [Shinella curvata]MDO6121077.1 hypothetical protein [Shinella curvata]